jgi:iron complex transport system substrate-binding protein
VLTVTACGAGVSDSGVADPPATSASVVVTDPAPAPEEVAATTEPTATDDEVVVSLGEEFLLADLLALGVVPVASTATVPTAGFQGLGQFETEGIEALPSTDVNLERLAALQPDVIVTTEFLAGQVGEALLADLGELVVIDDDATADEQLQVLAERFDATDAADLLLAELDAARADLADAIAARPQACEVSLATVYPGPSPAAWTTGATEIPAAVLEAGCTLRPGADVGEADRNGRLFLSLEQLGLLDAPRLVLLQSDAVEGETDAVAALADNPLWATVPAVTAAEVVTLDRLGYPGVVGQIALQRDLVAALAS